MVTRNALNVAERRMQPPSVAVSTVAFSLEVPTTARTGNAQGECCPVGDPRRGASTLWIPLVRRIRPPFRGAWALPGGPTQWDETLGETAMSTLVSATQITPNYLEQLYAFGSVERSAEAQRIVTIAYWAQYGVEKVAGASISNEDPNVAWFSVDELPTLAFDHAEIIRVALERLRAKTSYSVVAHRFLGEEFTLAQLRRANEVILNHELDPANFRRQILASNTLEETGKRRPGRHRPAKVYRFATENTAANAAANAAGN